MPFQLKKPSDLEIPVAIDTLHTGLGGSAIACYCPKCGVEHQWLLDWPINIPIICNNIDDDVKCKCRFVITNDTPIEN